MPEKEIILRYLRDRGDWVLEGLVRSIDTPYGHIGFRGDRNCRELVAEGKLDRRETPQGFAEVRYHDGAKVGKHDLTSEDLVKLSLGCRK